MQPARRDPPRQRSLSLEALLEQAVGNLEILHPGELAMTDALAELCRITPGQWILDTAAGTGASACHLARSRRARAYGCDIAWPMVLRARNRARRHHADCHFLQGDAQALPFADNCFDAAISECTLCLLDKSAALAEMVRVVRPGGYVGMHDLCWQRPPPRALADRLARMEGTVPETLADWQAHFEKAGMVDIVSQDHSAALKTWTRELRRRLGWRGRFRLFLALLRQGGPRSLYHALLTERTLRSRFSGYGLVVGRKPSLS